MSDVRPAPPLISADAFALVVPVLAPGKLNKRVGALEQRWLTHLPVTPSRWFAAPA